MSARRKLERQTSFIQEASEKEAPSHDQARIRMTSQVESIQNSRSQSMDSRREKSQVYDYSIHGISPTASTRIANTVARLQKEMEQMAKEM